MSAPAYPDHVWHGSVAAAANEPLARDTYRLRFACPEIARRVVPGQFVMLRLAHCNDPLLGRPLAVYDVASDAEGRPHWIDVVYLVVGKMTGRLAELPVGTPLVAWGPLGTGFPPNAAAHLGRVAGGIGQTPFLALAREALGRQRFGDPPREAAPAKKVTLCYGARSGEYLAGVEDFRRQGVEVHLSTDDGSQGRRGFVTELIRPVIETSAWPCRMVCCGPEPMLKAVGAIAAELGVPCQVSLESPMACGLGICFSCVAKVRDAGGAWDYRRTCIEGPVFNAEEIEF